MKMALKFITLAVLISLTLSECNEGCSICRPNGTCILCDFVNAYYLNNNSCSKDTSGNCKLYQVNTANGSCLICNDGYYIDSTQKCVEVTTEIENCKTYSNNATCSQCVSGFILGGNTCVEVTNKIDGCQTYVSADATTCVECELNYILSIDGTTCTFNPSIRNCATFSYIECQACTTGTYLHRNAYLDSFKAAISANSATLLNTKAFSLLRGSIDQIASTKCVTTEGTNCTQFNSIGICQECATGYYLDDSNLCVINPIEPISFCAFYSSLTTCGICDEGYHLDADAACVADADITNCQSFNPSASTTTCTQCIDTYYLLENTCVLRTNDEIANCSGYSVTADRCITCSNGNILTSDGLQCLAPIENCVTYGESNISTLALTCSKCADTFYLNTETNTCIPGTITNCLSYQTTTNVCETCRTGFYLSDSTCVARTASIANCQSYSNIDNDKCDTCNSSSILFGLNRSCKAIQAIANCDNYVQWNICSKCINGYELSDNTCVLIPENQNCLQKVGNGCILCKSSYYLTDGVCYILPEMVTSNCLTVDSNPTSPLACQGCNQNYVPFMYTNKYLCRNTSKLTGNLITNCTKYNSENGVLKCVRCQNTHNVSVDGLSCVLNCGTTETTMIGNITYEEMGVESKVTVDSYKKCYNIEEEEDLEGCEYASVALNAPNNKKVCLKCKSGYIPIQTCPMEIAFFDALNINNNDLGASYITVACVQNANARYAPNSSTTPVANCSYYITDGNNNYYCKRCDFGYTSSIQIENSISFVTCAQTVTGCDRTVKFGGIISNAQWMEEMFGFNISYAYSCHKCTNENEIPFLHLNYQNELTPYGLTNNIPSTSNTLQDNHMVCREPSAAGLQMSEVQFTSFPANCALGLYVVDKVKKANIALGTTALCLACKNGFKPVYGDNEFLITGCEQITNCNTTSTTDGWFNSCKACATGYAYQYDPVELKLKTDVCVSTTKQNCFAVESESNNCAICNKFTVFNYDGVCETLKPNACTNYVDLTSNKFNSDHTYNNLNLAYHFLLNEGCVSCNNDFVLVNEPITYETCNFSSYVQTGTYPSPTEYIAQCNSYYFDEELKCRTCQTGYIPNTENNKCILATTFPNCTITNETGSSCEVCNSTTTRVGNFCVTRSITNCAVYVEGNSIITCQTCANGFVLNNNTCSAGTVNNCNIYDQDTGLCTACNTGYVLVTEEGTAQQCMTIPSALNCATAELTNENEDLLCNSCISGFAFTYDDAEVPDNTCVQVNLVNNCSAYDIKSDLEESTFKCTACNSLFYLSNSSCISRTVTTGCATYVSTQNKCASCINNYYLDTNGVCKAFTVGIKNCSTYTNATTCKSCLPGFYLNENTCLVVAEADKIPNCTHYSNATTCSVCESTYVLTDNECLQAIAQNCNSYTDVNNCSSCPKGYYLSLNSETQVTSCLQSNISNCEEITSVEPLACIKCSGPYVVNASGVCVPVTTTILNCESYDNTTQGCQICASGFILSVDTKSCIEYTGPSEFSQCTALRYMETAICTACNPGYYFDQNVCVKCTSQNYETGCLLCDYTRQTSCLVCRSGFIQDENQNCTLNSSLITAFENQVEHISIVSTFMLVLIGFLFIRA